MQQDQSVLHRWSQGWALQEPSLLTLKSVIK